MVYYFISIDLFVNVYEQNTRIISYLKIILMLYVLTDVIKKSTCLLTSKLDYWPLISRCSARIWFRVAPVLQRTLKKLRTLKKKVRENWNKDNELFQSALISSISTHRKETFTWSALFFIYKMFPMIFKCTFFVMLWK